MPHQTAPFFCNCNATFFELSLIFFFFNYFSLKGKILNWSEYLQYKLLLPQNMFANFWGLSYFVCFHKPSENKETLAFCFTSYLHHPPTHCHPWSLSAMSAFSSRLANILRKHKTPHYAKKCFNKTNCPLCALNTLSFFSLFFLSL